MKLAQRGNFLLGLVVGLLIGLSLALGVALYITKAPVPFVDKVPQRTAEQDRAEAERNRQWDPNAALSGRSATRPGAGSAPGAGNPAAAPDPAAILSGAPVTGTAANPSTGPAPDPFMYFVQVGAYTRAEDAEAERARLALLGLEGKLSEREQAGRTVYRVRVGPLDTREQAEAMQTRLAGANFEGRLVRVERP
jgi:cell division protein FtsN